MHTADGTRGTYRVPLNSKKIVGVYSSRGNRESVSSCPYSTHRRKAHVTFDDRYQEDAYAIHAIQISPSELQKSLKISGHAWDPAGSAPPRSNGKAKADDHFLAGQVAFFGIYDGSVLLVVHGAPTDLMARQPRWKTSLEICSREFACPDRIRRTLDDPVGSQLDYQTRYVAVDIHRPYSPSHRRLLSSIQGRAIEQIHASTATV